MEVQEALVQIHAIRAQVTRSETFRGYRAATVACTGMFALGAAALQSVWIPDPRQDVNAYLRLWIAVAAASIAIVAAELIVRWIRTDTLWAREQTVRAIEQFSPCVIAGGGMTWAMTRFAPDSLTLLPALWAIVFSLGVFASSRQLPRAVLLVAGYYLVTGIARIPAGGDSAFSPWAMASTFGVGQLLTAAILYWALERHHAKE